MKAYNKIEEDEDLTTCQKPIFKIVEFNSFSLRLQKSTVYSVLCKFDKV